MPVVLAYAPILHDTGLYAPKLHEWPSVQGSHVSSSEVRRSGGDGGVAGSGIAGGSGGGAMGCSGCSGGIAGSNNGGGDGDCMDWPCRSYQPRGQSCGVCSRSTQKPPGVHSLQLELPTWS